MENIIKLFINNSGAIQTAKKDFNIYKGSRGIYGIEVYVPVTMLNRKSCFVTGKDNPENIDEILSMNSVKVGAIGIRNDGQQIKTSAYEMVYLQTILINNVEYAIYTRPDGLPSDFLRYSGDVQLIFNLNRLIRNEDNEITSERLTTTQIFNLQVLASDTLDNDEQPTADDITSLYGMLNDVLSYMKEVRQTMMQLKNMKTTPIEIKQDMWLAQGVDSYTLNLDLSTKGYVADNKKFVELMPEERRKYDGYTINATGLLTLYTRVPWSGYVLVSGVLADGSSPSGDLINYYTATGTDKMTNLRFSNIGTNQTISYENLTWVDEFGNIPYDGQQQVTKAPDEFLRAGDFITVVDEDGQAVFVNLVSFNAENKTMVVNVRWTDKLGLNSKVSKSTFDDAEHNGEVVTNANITAGDNTASIKIETRNVYSEVIKNIETEIVGGKGIVLSSSQSVDVSGNPKTIITISLAEKETETEWKQATV